ncbi:MAG: hypothetical protein ABI190_06740 [Casimicrobiaceae bacterium]
MQNWKVLPHGQLLEVDDNLRTVTGDIEMPLMKLQRRMTVVRLRDSRLVIFSAIALAENEMAALEAFGQPAFLIVPNDRHRLDAKIWKERYPGVKVVAAPGARANVEKLVAVATTAPDFGDPAVQFIVVAGTLQHEAALLVRSSHGATLVLNDIVGNIRDAQGIGGWLLHLAGFAGTRPRIPRVVRMAMVKDPAALRAQLLQWSRIETLQRILVSHGAPIDRDPKAVLQVLAQSLV